MRVLRLVVPSTKEAHQHARAGCRVCLTALHGVEDRLAGVFHGPHGCVSGRADLPIHDRHTGLWILEEGLGHALRAGLLRRGLAEEVLFLHGGEAGVRVAAADHAELVRVRAQLRFEQEAVLERRARVFVFKHILCLRNAAVEIALVPDLKAGELVIGREVGVRLAGALGLGHLIEPLPLGACLGIGLVDLLTEGLDNREHGAIAQISVVGDGEHLAAGLLFCGSHPFPEVLGVVASERLQRGVGFNEACLHAVLAEDDIAVKVVAARVRGPFKPYERSEPAGVVIGFCSLDRLLPGRAVCLCARKREPLGQLVLSKADDDVHRSLGALAALDLIMPSLALLR